MLKRMINRKSLIFGCIIFSLMYIPSIFAAESYKIGAVVDVTGPASILGIPEKNAILLLLDEINKDMGGINGHPLDVIIYDSEGDSSKAVLAFKKLIEQDKVLGLIGASRSGDALAAIPFIEKAEIPYISFGSSKEIVRPIKKWVFKAVQEDYLSWLTLFKYLKKIGITKVAVLTSSDGFGESGKKAIEEISPKIGMKVVTSERFGPKDVDMTAQLSRMRGTDAQAVVVSCATPAASIVTKNFRQLGIKIPLVHGPAYDINFMKLEGEAGNDVIFVSSRMMAASILPLDDPQKQLLLRFKEQYKLRYGQDADVFAGLAWDSLALMAIGLEKAGPNKAGIRDAIENIRGWVGTQGVYNMSKTDHSGLDANIVMKVVDAKTFKIIIVK